MNATIAIESLGNTLGNKRAFAIIAQNSEIVRGESTITLGFFRDSGGSR